ncbi:MAG TPA: hypothetical protein VL123_04060 [Candidatus Udaeobacter sp.]|jgi:hypothetical protein|nr:hypothetical protein [Candidatus Udaeobacter sp.]
MPNRVWRRARVSWVIGSLALATSSIAAPRAPAELPFIADDLPRAVAEAREQRQPIFIEAWAPW